MKKINIKIAVISVLLALVTLFLFGCQETAILPPTLIDIERTGQDLPLTKGAGMTAEQLAAAILTPATATLLTTTIMIGDEDQFEVYTTSLTGFPTDGSSYALMSTGNASDIAGVATTFYSFNTGGPSSPPLSHRGNISHDIAKLSLTLSVPAGAETLSFDWKFGTEENPTYIGPDGVIDWASAIVNTSAGSTNILLFPDDNPVDVNNAIPYSNMVTGSSSSPGPPYPLPDETVYNAVTGMYTSTFDVAPFVGQTITIDFWVGDELDRILDSALFIDNLIIEGEIDVAVDIKPESCPNPINVKSKGVFPVAILGTEDFDVTEIDPDTITLWTERGGDATPLHWALEDVATPYIYSPEDEEEYMCTTDGPDGYTDLTLTFDIQEIVDALGEPENVHDGDVEFVWLTGNLLNGITINGKDVIIIIKKGK
jgi:hypothetical protein